jgi:hypothetical protein
MGLISDTKSENSFQIYESILQMLSLIPRSSKSIRIAIASLDSKNPQCISIFSDYMVDPFDVNIISKLMDLSSKYGILSIYPVLRLLEIFDLKDRSLSLSSYSAILLNTLEKLSQARFINDERKCLLSKLMIKIQLFSGNISKHADGDLPTPSENQLYIGYELALTYLQELVFSSEYGIAEIAIDICGRLLSLSADVALFLCDLDILKKPIMLIHHIPVIGTLDNDLLWNSNGRDQDTWVLDFVSALLESFECDEVFNVSTSLLIVDSVYARLMIPYIIHQQLLKERLSQEFEKTLNAPYRMILSKNIQRLFSSATENDSYIVKLFLEVINFLNQTDRNDWLELNYFQISKCALFTSNYLHGLYYIERWFSDTYQMTSENANMFENSLLDCYKGLGDKDGFEGAISVLDVTGYELSELLHQKNEHASNWDKICKIQDATLQINDSSTLFPLLNALGKSGYFHILQQLVLQTNKTHYESLWRLGKWELPCTKPSIKTSYDEYIYFTLKYLEQAPTLLDLQLSISERLKSPSINYLKMLPFLEIQESLSFYAIDFSSVDMIFDCWDLRTDVLLKNYNFQEIEGIFATRTRMLTIITRGQESLPEGNIRKSIDQYFAKHLLKFVEMAIDADAEILARTSLYLFKTFFNECENEDYKWNYSILCYKLEWSSSDKLLAFKYVNNLVDKMNTTNVSLSNQAEGLCLCGKWAQEIRAL